MIPRRDILIALAFNLIFQFVEGISNCTNVYISDNEGVITSPNYPNQYPDSLSCSWHINIPKNTILSISIVDLNIEPDDPGSCGAENEYCCLHNWLAVSLATQPRTTRLICGNHPVQSFNLPDTLKYGSIKFHSSKNTNGDHGFKLKYGIVPASPKSCSSSEFKCANGERCIGAAQQCDGINDCEDKSDESTCKQRCISRGLQSCPDTPSVCYNASSNACARLSQCPIPAKQGEWLPCKDERSCYHKEQLCDNNFDCGDQSDEANCPASTTSSTSEPSVFFMCDNWKWVSSSKVCDGTDDCGDDSDEEGCVRPSLETAIILGCLSCSLLFILLASYTFHAHNHHQRRSQQTESTPRIRPLLSSHPYIMPFREPPPPYPMDPPPRSRRYRRHRRHSRLPSSQVTNPPTSVPLDEQCEPPPQEQASSSTWKAPDEQQDGTTSTE